jgi:DnaJ-class molecular chaperone
MVKDTTLYDRLEVPSNASTADIIKAFKRLAIKCHPDKNPDNPDSVRLFQEINQAKEILSNKEKRDLYDQIGMDSLNGGGQHQNVNPEDLFKMFGAGGHPFAGAGNPFAGFGGAGGHPFGGFGRQPTQEKENIILNQQVTLEQIYNEELIQIQFQQKHYCSKCNGEGTSDGSKLICGTCNGKGMLIQIIQMGPVIQQMQQPCPHCRGSGKTSNNENKCTDCNGDAFKMKDFRINIPLKNGLTNGQQIQLPSHGHNLKDGRTDLIIVINEKEHPEFKRNGADLIINVKLKLYQALFGFDKVINHLDKRKLHISHSGKTNYNTTRKISGEGMKNLINGSKGDLIIKFDIDLINNLSNENSKKLLEILKLFEEEEVKNELDVINNKSSYVKTFMIKTDYDDEKTQSPQAEEGKPQCVHQ